MITARSTPWKTPEHGRFLAGRIADLPFWSWRHPLWMPAARAAPRVLARGEGPCPGAAVGLAVADSEEGERRAAVGEDVLLVRETTSPDDVHGMIAARGVVTAQGGATSHAAVVSRALGRPCSVGAAGPPSTRWAGSSPWTARTSSTGALSPWSHRTRRPVRISPG